MPVYVSVPACLLATSSQSNAMELGGDTHARAPLSNHELNATPSALRQRVSDDVISGRGLHEVMPAGHDDEILPAAELIDHRIGLTAGRQEILPQRRAGFDIDGADEIVGRRGDEDNPPAVTTAPPLFGVPILIGSMEGMPHGPLRARRAERAVPNGSPRAQIDGAYAAIGRLFAEETRKRHAPAGVDFDGETAHPFADRRRLRRLNSCRRRAPDRAAPIRVGLLRHAGRGGCSSAGRCNWR